MNISPYSRVEVNVMPLFVEWLCASLPYLSLRVELRSVSAVCV